MHSMSMEQKLEAALAERDELIASYVAVKFERDEMLTRIADIADNHLGTQEVCPAVELLDRLEIHISGLHLELASLRNAMADARIVGVLRQLLDALDKELGDTDAIAVDPPMLACQAGWALVEELEEAQP